MLVDQDLCYQALKSRDARFDGRFFTAVVTTGIYCRPICPARTPLRKNVRFFPCAAAAEEAGFRPCRRCRPESAPGTPCWMGTSATVSRALRLIERGTLDNGSVELLAAQVGVGGRYLRRLFAKHLGTSPQSVAMSRRAHFARILLGATALPVTQVAHASGFGSVRQFNETIRSVFDRSPTELRRQVSSRSNERGTVVLKLSFRPPLAWKRLLAFLAARAVPGVEEVDRSRYRRTFVGRTGSGVLEVSLAKEGHSLDLRVDGAGPTELLEVVRRVRRMFDLDADPLAIASALKSSNLLRPAVLAHPGLRVPGTWDSFEALVRAILGQQISVAAATTLSGRVAHRFGTAVEARGGLTHLFPAPEVLAKADLSVIGIPRVRAQALSDAAAVVARDPNLLAPAANLEQLIVRLCALPGVGQWTAHYLAMRAFNEPDAFPFGDLGLRRAVGGVQPRYLEALSHSWRPWRAYAAMYLWTHPLKEVNDAVRAIAS